MSLASIMQVLNEYNAQKRAREMEAAGNNWLTNYESAQTPEERQKRLSQLPQVVQDPRLSETFERRALTRDALRQGNEQILEAKKAEDFIKQNPWLASPSRIPGQQGRIPTRTEMYQDALAAGQESGLSPSTVGMAVKGLETFLRPQTEFIKSGEQIYAQDPEAGELRVPRGFIQPRANPYEGLDAGYETFLRANQLPNSPQSYRDWQNSVIEQKKAGAVTVNNNINNQQTPGRKKTDELFAQEYSDFVAAGGYADVEKNIEQLKEVATLLETEKGITGPGVGYVPELLQPLANPEALAAREAVEEVAQRNLRLILGAQFTQKEGDRLIARAFNPKLGQKENLKRVNRLIRQIETAAKAKAEAAQYFEQNGTLTGWTGKVYTATDFLTDRVPEAEEEDKPPVKGARKAKDGKWYVEQDGTFYRVEPK